MLRSRSKEKNNSIGEIKIQWETIISYGILISPIGFFPMVYLKNPAGEKYSHRIFKISD